MPLVVDTAAIISLAFPDENPSYSQAVIEAIAIEGVIVPTLFWYEVRNALLTGERRKRITPEQTQAFLADLAVLPFEVDDVLRETTVLDLARRHTLTVYDAVYLELAQRRNTPLATVDQDLVRAAAMVGVTVWQAAR